MMVLLSGVAVGLVSACTLFFTEILRGVAGGDSADTGVDEIKRCGVGAAKGCFGSGQT